MLVDLILAGIVIMLGIYIILILEPLHAAKERKK